MSKSARRFQEKGRDRRPVFGEQNFPIDQRTPPIQASKKPLAPQTDNQARYLNSIKTNDVTLGLGPAGTGKTYVATAWAADQIATRQYGKLIITRPAIEAGEDSIGFLPGDMGEKMAPYMRPIFDVLNERIGSSHVEGMVASGRIEIAPLGFLRGWTFKDAIVILDEAQNTTPQMMKMFLTRLGEGSKLIVNGDIRQTDIKGMNGLYDAKKRLDGLTGVGQITFTRDDIVRHGLVREIIDRYECGDDERADDQPDLPGVDTIPFLRSLAA